MHKYICILLLLLFCGQSVAVAEKLKIEHENILNVQYGGIWLQDQYLTP